MRRKERARIDRYKRKTLSYDHGRLNAVYDIVGGGETGSCRYGQRTRLCCEQECGGDSATRSRGGRGVQLTKRWRFLSLGGPVCTIPPEEQKTVDIECSPGALEGVRETTDSRREVASSRLMTMLHRTPRIRRNTTGIPLSSLWAPRVTLRCSTRICDVATAMTSYQHELRGRGKWRVRTHFPFPLFAARSSLRYIDTIKSYAMNKYICGGRMRARALAGTPRHLGRRILRSKRASHQRVGEHCCPRTLVYVIPEESLVRCRPLGRNGISDGDKSLLGELNREQDAFIKNQESRAAAAAAPWAGAPNEAALKEECLSLSTDRRNFVRAPPAGVEFDFDYDKMYPVALAVMAEDPNLEKMRFDLVPKVSDSKIFSVHALRISLIVLLTLFIAVLKDIQACEPSKSRWSPPPMDVRNYRGVITAFLTAWVEIHKISSGVGLTEARVTYWAHLTHLMRTEIVITEENFWRNYFYRVSLICQANEADAAAERQPSADDSQGTHTHTQTRTGATGAYSSSAPASPSDRPISAKNDSRQSIEDVKRRIESLKVDGANDDEQWEKDLEAELKEYEMVADKTGDKRWEKECEDLLGDEEDLK
ncbi:Synapse-associated protein of 47 kDa [Eumeta japonica]|uniref:Synapse-associated protein of 47 kDa n=1 Tax=Eumeta variegata TaxID=151549 RepID=A0A4C1Y774_EUMVA|nr:Synapse-associated protein of 47 kDa [Eumeta japonica]